MLFTSGLSFGFQRRALQGGSWMVRVSLAGAGHWIREHGLLDGSEFAGVPNELDKTELEALMVDHESPVGRIRQLAPVVQMSETPARWSRPAVPRGYHPPVWPAPGS